MNFSNAEVAEKLREVAAAYTLKKANLFQIRAYENGADSIEHLTSEIKDLWEEGNLDKVPGIGESLQDHLGELFKTGKVKHWENAKKGIPQVVFKLLDIPGVGPKTALKLGKLGIKSGKDLVNKLRSGELVKNGFSEKLARRIGNALKRVSPEIKNGRMMLPYAFTQAEKILNHLKKSPSVEKADALGSLRRMVATVGDIDIAVASQEPQKAVEQIISLPGVVRVVNKGEVKVRLIITPNLQVDFLIIDPKSYGASLQYFTGSKSHNIHLRTIAEHKGLSLSEYGVKNTKTGKLHPTPAEKEFYGLLEMEVPPPELREDTGEVEMALKHNLPDLVELKNIRGDLHVHSDLIQEPSHDIGADSVSEIMETAKKLGYSYVGIADHQPSASKHNEIEMIKALEKRKKIIEDKHYSDKNIRVLNLLEVDILVNGDLAVPDSALKFLDFAIAGVHSVHNLPKEQMTKRILKALKNPYVKVLSHPTNRLLDGRGSSEADWEEIFKFAAKNKKALEINAWPNRLDLPDGLVKRAKEFGVKFVINTDSHEKSQMKYMKFGVAVAKRGWATRKDIINAWDWTRFSKWFNIN